MPIGNRQPSERKNERTGVTIVDANVALDFTITKIDIGNASCKDPTQCVIAQALKRVQVFCDGFQIGSKITKLFSLTGKKVVRYSTPAALRAALYTFDKTGKWYLEVGNYQLLPLNASYRRGNRWDKKKKGKKGVQSTFRGKPVQPTRHAQTIFQIVNSLA